MKQTGTQTVQIPIRDNKVPVLLAELVRWNKERINFAKGFWKFGDYFDGWMDFKTILVENDVHATSLLRRAEINSIKEGWELVVRTIESIKYTYHHQLYYFEEFVPSIEMDNWANESPNYKYQVVWSKTQMDYADQLLFHTKSFIALMNGRVLDFSLYRETCDVVFAEADRMRRREVEAWLIKTIHKLNLKFNPTAERCVIYDSNQYAYPKTTNGNLRITLSNGAYLVLPIKHHYKGNIKLVWDNERLTLHNGYERVTPDIPLPTCRNEVYGTDWNLKKDQLLVGEDGVCFGDINGPTKAKLKVQKKEQERTKLKKLVADYAITDHEKALRILKNNLGTKTIDRLWHKTDDAMVLMMRTALHKLGRHMNNEGKICNGYENLHFSGKSRNKEESRMTHMSGYGKLREYRDYILQTYGVRPVAVNPAYTSRWVSLTVSQAECMDPANSAEDSDLSGGIGTRKGDLVEWGGVKVPSGRNAGRNIGDRVLDLEIQIHHSKEQVKETLLKRPSREATGIGGVKPDILLAAAPDSARNPEETKGTSTLQTPEPSSGYQERRT